MNGVLHQKKLVLHKAINTELSKSKKAKIFAYYKGFTIVELLVVIAVIAILAVLSVVTYLGITNQAHVASLSSGLADSAKALENYKVSNTITNTETYPAKLSDLTNLKLDNSINWTYYVQSSTDSTQNTTYCLQGTINNLTQSVSSSNPTVVTKPCIENGLVGWWKLNGDATDSSGNGNNGVLHGTTSATGPNGNGALYFNGTSSDYISINNFDYGVLMPNAINSSWTMSIWAKYGSYISGAEILLGRIGFNGGIIAKGSSSMPTYSFEIFTNNHSQLYTLTSYADTSWHLLSAVYSNGKMIFYADGNLIGMSTIADIFPYSKNLGIGASDSGGWPFNGTLDDARVYNRILSPSEISALYAAGAQ